MWLWTSVSQKSQRMYMMFSVPGAKCWVLVLAMSNQRDTTNGNHAAGSCSSAA
jgi:hypothetical protein